jgi:UrcA family protein
MNTKPPLTFWSSRRRTLFGFAVLAAIGIASVATHADPSAATAASSRVADVSLADLNLSTPEGMSAARERLQAMAQRVCAEHASSTQPNFATCVDSTLAGALRQIDALKRINATSGHSVTRAANVSLADLNLSTLEGSHAAHERLESMAQRLCTELARNHELTYQPNYAACVHDTLAGAWAQANAIRAVNDRRTVQRATP